MIRYGITRGAIPKYALPDAAWPAGGIPGTSFAKRRKGYYTIIWAH
jgi:hypothetical protein